MGDLLIGRGWIISSASSGDEASGDGVESNVISMTDLEYG
jgi:hypothetical protein